MLTLLLATWVLAAAPPPVQAQLHLRAEDHGRLRLTLCFSGQGQRVDYHLDVASSAASGTSRSRQSGSLVAEGPPQCPIDNRIGLSEPGRVDATLHWSVDGEPQPPLRSRHPSPAPPPPLQPPPLPWPEEQFSEPTGLFAASGYHGAPFAHYDGRPLTTSAPSWLEPACLP